MIVFLIGVSHRPSVTLRVLADLWERGEGHTVVVHELSLSVATEDPRRLDRIIGLVDEAGPARAALPCTLWNTAPVTDLCRRLVSLWPDLGLTLWGPTAPLVVETLPPGAKVDVLAHPAEDGTSSHFGRQRLGELARAARQFGCPLVVEGFSGAGLPLHQLRLNPGLPEGNQPLSADQALSWTRPLLHAGLPVRLEAPEITSEPGATGAFLAGLGGGRLTLEAPVESLDYITGQLERVRPQQLDLDLTALADGVLEPDWVLEQLQRLHQLGIYTRGILVFGRPGVDVATFNGMVDRALRAGVEDLALRRLLTPPGSTAAAELVASPSPPYQVLGHHRGTPADLLRCDQLGATLGRLKDPLLGTGIFRALCRSLGSAVEPLEGFNESLAAADGRDNAPIEHLFISYLRQHHGIDLEAGKSQLKLIRSPGLSLRWLGDGSRLVTDESTGRVAHLGSGALTVIDRCERPQTLHELCEQLVREAPPERRDRLRRELRVSVDKLSTMGFLVPSATEGFQCSAESPFLNLDEFEYHYRMLMDRPRVEAYGKAIAAVVRPGMHVLEIGTGTGVLAVLAAQAGARVTAIERYAVVEIAHEVAGSSGVADRIELVRGRSDLVQIAEPADVLVSELVGNRILNEAMLEVTLDARRRLLRPGARLIPSGITILAQLGWTDRFNRFEGELAVAGRHYGVDLSPLGAWLRHNTEAGTLLWELDDEDNEVEMLSEEAEVVEINLEGFDHAVLDCPFSVVANRSGQVNAVVLSFRLELQPGIELSTCGAQHGLHWSKPVAMLADAIDVESGSVLDLSLCYERGGEMRVRSRS